MSCKKIIKPEPIRNIDELIKWFRKLSEKNYIFRGQCNDSWTLQSSLERVFLDKYESVAKKYEDYSYNFFVSRFNVYGKSHNVPTAKLEWLSIMQHHGVPTRMLDFTYSPYVALYFAFENMLKPYQGNCAIYAIDYMEILNRSLESLNREDIKITLEQLSYNRDEIFNKINNKSPDILLITEPNVFNSRLEKQKGCFLVPNTYQTIEQVLGMGQYDGIDHYRFIVPCSFCNEVYALLKQMNIDGKAIYGDLEGLSKSIKNSLYAYAEVEAKNEKNDNMQKSQTAHNIR